MSYSSRICISIFVFCFIININDFAFANIFGYILDENERPVAFATVYFFNENDTAILNFTKTDEDGKFEFPHYTFVDNEIENPEQFFNLKQNFPNPFNPSTTIPFVIYHNSRVNLTIYNILGQKVRTLVDDYMLPGPHDIIWDGKNDFGYSVSGGMYIYQLVSDNQKKSKKMILLDGGYKGSGGRYVQSNFNRENASKISTSYKFNLEIVGDDIIDSFHEVILNEGENCICHVRRLPYEIKLATIPKGSFKMGSDWEFDQENPNKNTGIFIFEIPVNTVSLSAFRMSVTEITQHQYEGLTGCNPSYFRGDRNLPVERVSWYDAVRYCNLLSDKVGLDKCYNEKTWTCDFSKNGFRLPTEAEWEYACRFSTITNFYSGDSEEDLAVAGWYYYNGEGKTHPVGQKLPNGYGLYDMHGNLWEWCNDWFEIYPEKNQTNPQGPYIGIKKILRGGDWSYPAFYCRSAFRHDGAPAHRNSLVGFRIVKNFRRDGQ